MMEYCKLQLGCIIIVLYIAFVYYHDSKQCHHRKEKHSKFEGVLFLGLFLLLFDGITAYTVNNLYSINSTVNMICHMIFLVGIDLYIFYLFLYMVSITTKIMENKRIRRLLYIPFVINILIVVINMPELEYRDGDISNYSMGISAYTCFIMAGVYILLLLHCF
ncbi:MAG: hypothetical protein SO170_10580 [Butyribacter sp.]|nr:hypothetical protein [bacterium]MDY3855381.1 hypothetical protein [Butyribacter sp.]